jgi:hypothetical protein
MDEHEKRVDLNSELGMSRRDLLRRSAIVGGTLLWVAPAIQSITPKALARQGPSPGACAACYCWNGTADKTTVTQDECSDDGVQGQRFSNDDCGNWCQGNPPFTGFAAAPGGPYAFHEYCSGPADGDCSCTQTGASTSRGVECAP